MARRGILEAGQVPPFRYLRNLPGPHDLVDRDWSEASEVTDSVEFSVTADDPQQVVPVVNGQSLIDLVADFETRQHFDVAGGYAGLIPMHFRFGDLTQHYLGRGTRQWPERGRAWLLGCDCGEVGCWPLDAKIDVVGDRVVWHDLRQPHRPNRDYRGLGPFAFARDDYDRAVRAAVGALDTSSPDHSSHRP